MINQTHRVALLLLATLLSVGGVQVVEAQNVDRTSRPATEPMPTVSFPEYQSFTLDNGLKVFLVRDERPLVTMRLLVRGGSALDGDRPGRAEFTADLMTKGAGNLDASEFASEIDFIGGGIAASAAADNVSVSASGLRSKFDRILELFTDVITNPAFSDDEIEKYRSIQLEGLKAARQQTDFLASTAINLLLYGPDSPLGTVPTEAVLEAITREDIRSYHSDHIVPNNASLAVVGNFTQTELKRALEEHLGDWKPGVEFNTGDLPTPNLDGSKIILIDRPTSVQSVIRIITPGPGPNDEARSRAFLLANVLGGGTGLGNRLTMNLRETHGWTYSPFGFFTSNTYVGYHVAGADVRNNVTDSAVVEMIAEIERIASEPVDAEELELNVKSAVGGYVMSLARPDVTARRVQSIDFYGMPRDYYDRLVSTYNTTTSDHLLEIAGQYFRREEMAIVVVGKADEIAEPLARVGPVELWDENFRPVKSESADDITMSVGEIWGKMIDAMGGKETLSGITSIVARGRAKVTGMGQTIPGTYTQLSLRPNLSYMEVGAQIPGMGSQKLIQQYIDGSSVTIMNMGREIPQSEGAADSAIAASRFLREVGVELRGASLELLGATTIDGQRAYVVALQEPGTEDVIYSIDSESFLPIRRTVGENQVDLGGWTRFPVGIVQPTRLTLKGEGGSIVVEEVEYDFNVDLPASKFRPEGG